jgi:hypothetical protein
MPQILVFSYHKTGTSLFLGVMTRLAQTMGLRLANLYGPVARVPADADIVLLPHSLLFGRLPAGCRAVRIVRDPRDIWVSGYLYHRHCNEPWCTNAVTDPTPPILVPRVDHAMMHWPEAAKAAYVYRLAGRSYRQNLLDRSREQGLDFELEGYTAATLAAMEAWRFGPAEVIDVQLETIMAGFDGAMGALFAHFGFSPGDIERALEVAQAEDINRMDDDAIAARPQIHARSISKWRALLTEAQTRRFEARYGALIERLGYRLAF